MPSCHVGDLYPVYVLPIKKIQARKHQTTGNRKPRANSLSEDINFHFSNFFFSPELEKCQIFPTSKEYSDFRSAKSLLENYQNFLSWRTFLLLRSSKKSISDPWGLHCLWVTYSKMFNSSDSFSASRQHVSVGACSKTRDKKLFFLVV